jgi:hypothetical protein
MIRWKIAERNEKRYIMSKELLYNLNGNANGLFKKHLDGFKGEPRIAWYPSAGEDFRALLYLSPKFSDLFEEVLNGEKLPQFLQHDEDYNLQRVLRKLPQGDEALRKKLPAPPDLFLFTDYYPWEGSTFLDKRTIRTDEFTTVSVENLEELPHLNLPLHKEIVDFPSGSIATNKVLFMNIKIVSNDLGTIRFPVLYAFVENEAFFCEKLNPFHAKISHIIHVRYGGGLGGGGNARGVWLQCVLERLKCELFVKDESNHDWAGGDEKFLELCPDVRREDSVSLTTIRTIPSAWWSGYGDVSFNLCGGNSA